MRSLPHLTTSLIRSFEQVDAMDHAPSHTTEIRLPLQSALVSIKAIRDRQFKEPTAVERGRKPRGWKDDFEEDLSEVGRALRAHRQLTPEAIRHTVRAYRARRLAEPREVHVTVPA